MTEIVGGIAALCLLVFVPRYAGGAWLISVAAMLLVLWLIYEDIYATIVLDEPWKPAAPNIAVLGMPPLKCARAFVAALQTSDSTLQVKLGRDAAKFDVVPPHKFHRLLGLSHDAMVDSGAN